MNGIIRVNQPYIRKTMPTLKLTERSIAALRAPHITGKQTLYWDEAQTGFAVLVSGKNNVKTYMAKGQLKKKAVLKKLGRVGVMTLDEARQAAREMFRDLGAGVDPRKQKTGAITLSESLEGYIKANALGPRTKESYAWLAKRHFADWIDRPLMEITREMVETRYRAIAEEIEARFAEQARGHAKLHLARAAKVEKAWPDAAKHHRAKAEAAQDRKAHSGKATANAAMRVLRAIYNYELDRDPNFPPNPVRLRRQWHKIKPRERYVSGDDMAKFYKGIMELDSEIGRDYLRLVMFTGLRRREAAALRWSEVDLTARTITIPATRNKSGRKFDLPMTDFVHDLLATRRAIGKTEFIFHANSASGHIETPNHHLAQIANATSVRVSIHDLRRTFVTIAESCDISPIALKALVNHGIGSDVTSGYIQIVVERLREPAQRVTDRIKALCAITAATTKVVKLRA
jgi:integrase